MTYRDCRRRSSSRRGAAIIVVLVCVLVAVAIGLAATQRLVLHRRGQLHHTRGLQAEYLLESFRERTIHKLALDVNYQGEVLTWAPEDSGLAEIAVTVSGTGDRLTAEAVVEYGNSLANQARKQDRWVFLLEAPTIPENLADETVENGP
jgi:hypothetical protein